MAARCSLLVCSGCCAADAREKKRQQQQRRTDGDVVGVVVGLSVVVGYVLLLLLRRSRRMMEVTPHLKSVLKNYQHSATKSLQGPGVALVAPKTEVNLTSKSGLHKQKTTTAKETIDDPV